ncbi:MAG: hypothetical protein V4539_17025 [Bacteroidota bacterium]
MKLVLAALSIVLASALIYIGLTEISCRKGIENIEIGFHIRLTGKDLLKGEEMHTIKEDPKSRFSVKRRKDMLATVADSANNLEYRTGKLDSSYDAKDSSMKNEQRKRELYIGEDKLDPDSSELYKLNEK